MRADEIVHAGNINVPMYEQLLKADVVVADVSTYNCNAFYELGVRHALRPYTTIIISEDGMTFPFDVGQIAIRKYHHLGEGIDYEEVERMKQELSEAMKIISEKETDDSPVYTFIKDLKPPMLTVAAETIAATAATLSLQSEGPDAVTDFVLAQRTRRRVVDICQALMDKTKMEGGAKRFDPGATYWVLATLAEAWTGLGNEAKSQEYQNQAPALNPPPAQWMIDSTQEQLKKLRARLPRARRPLDGKHGTIQRQAHATSRFDHGLVSAYGQCVPCGEARRVPEQQITCCTIIARAIDSIRYDPVREPKN
jgi:hypothetical protein